MENLQHILRKRLGGAKKILILGVGSELRGDDAAGMLAAKSIEQECAAIDERLKVILASTAPENFTGEIKRFSPTHIVIIDSADAGRKPGEITIAKANDICGISFSTHQMPLKVMLDYLKESLPCEVLVVGIQPQVLQFGQPVSGAVQEAVQNLVAAFKEAILIK